MLQGQSVMYSHKLLGNFTLLNIICGDCEKRADLPCTTLVSNGGDTLSS